jgi:hypothetical protein
MIDRHTQHEAARRDLERQLKWSTDPEWVRQQMGEHQFSKTFIIVAGAVGALAMWAVFVAIASI